MPIQTIQPIRIPTNSRIPRTTILETIPNSITSYLEPPVVNQIKPPVISIPSGEIPSFEPPVVQEEVRPEYGGSNQGRREPELNTDEIERYLADPSLPPLGNEGETETQIELPVVGLVTPPTTAEMTLAGTTAIASVSVALASKALVEALAKLLKPVVRKAMLKAKTLFGFRLSNNEVQEYMVFEGKGMKEVNKLLKVSQQRQQLETLAQQRQNTP